MRQGQQIDARKTFVFGLASLRATYLASSRHSISASPIDARQNGHRDYPASAMARSECDAPVCALM